MRSLARCNSPFPSWKVLNLFQHRDLVMNYLYICSCVPGVATPELTWKWSCLHVAMLGSVNTEEPLPFSFNLEKQFKLLFKASFKGLSLQKQLFVPQLSSCTTPTSLRNRDLINSFWHKLSLNKVMHACWDEI